MTSLLRMPSPWHSRTMGTTPLPCRKKAMEMPKVSRDTATQGGDYGAIVDRSEEFGDYTVDFLTFREHLSKSLDAVTFCYLGDARFNMDVAREVGNTACHK